MKAVIMAAGLGTRLRPLTLNTPKPMLQVAGRPILERTFAILPPEVDEVILVVGYLREQIMAHFGDTWGGRRVRYVTQTEMRGTGEAVGLCRDFLLENDAGEPGSASRDDKFLVLNGDDLYDAGDLAVLARHDLAILAQKTDVSGRFGAFRIDAAGNLIDIVEGGEVGVGSLINAGAYVLDGRFFDYPLVAIKDGQEFGLPQTVVLVAKDHPVTIVIASFWLPIGFPEDLEKATVARNSRAAAGLENYAS